MKRISHYNWLYKNYEKVCKNANKPCHMGVISAHGDKLMRLKFMCEDLNLPFYKVSAMGLFVYEFYREHLAKDANEFAISLYNNHPEWYNGTGGEEDAIFEF